MTSILNICLFLLTKLKNLVNVKAVFRILILSFFVFGQIGTTAHAHDHEHSDDDPQTHCAFCILTVSDEDIWEDDVKVPDTWASDGPNFLKASRGFYIDLNEGGLTALEFVLYTQSTGRVRNELLKPTRAPPIH